MHEAVESASPEVASLLRRVIVEEPLAGDPELGDPVDSVVTVLLRGAVRRALAEVEMRVAGRGRLVAVAGGRDGASAPLAGPTRRIRRRARRRRSIGSVVGREGDESDRWQGEGERRFGDRDRGRGSGRCRRRHRRPSHLRRLRMSRFRPACRRSTSTRRSRSVARRVTSHRHELIEALHTVELTPEVLTDLIDRVRPRVSRSSRTRKRISLSRSRRAKATGPPSGPTATSKPELRRDTNGKRATLERRVGGQRRGPGAHVSQGDRPGPAAQRRARGGDRPDH